MTENRTDLQTDRRTATSTPAPQVWPALRARNARGLIDFLTTAFDFRVVTVHGDGDRVEHAELAGPAGGGVMLGSVRDDPEDRWPVPPGSGSVYVVVDDVPALHRRAAVAGAEILEAPVERDYGSTEFTARDPEGNLWSFGTYRGADWS
ncbi:VOC family protein [Nakamurella leprariae]|uniref:VOC family protein n=1 Tax=Nakamurella leprariae TaxID=2803911 RepID=A0A938YDW7_9ACTN|nr:VOC family protein [Nakamurella leprariae]MBM9468917.1 VOC family protein [Nakamurella leprariae]